MKSIFLAAFAVIWFAAVPAFAAGGADPDSLKNPVASNASSLERGAKLYNERCKVCHGEKYDGMGPAAGSMQAEPWSFVDGPVMDVSDGYLFQKIKNGGIWFEMGPYGLEYSDEDIWNLVNFIRSVKKK